MAGFLISVGLVLTFGAVGGMDAVPVWEPNPWFFEQVIIALVGVFMMFMGTVLIGEQR